jgi:hypothetical protein
MVLTHPEFRCHGFATQLFGHVIERADVLGIRTLKLDATEQGKPLYEKYGFKSEQPVERWGGEFHINHGLPSEGDLASCRELDADAFGTDRFELLQGLALRGSCFANLGGYLLTRPGGVASYVGPCLAKSAGAATEWMSSQFSQTRPEVEHPRKVAQVETDKGHEWYWDLLPANQNAVVIAEGLGFTRRRSLTRMFRGEALRTRDELVYASAGFELG